MVLTALTRAWGDLLRPRIFGVVVLGVALTLVVTIPFVNVLVPVLAAAGFTHLYHLSTRR